jgi:hypothetical protein
MKSIKFGSLALFGIISIITLVSWVARPALGEVNIGDFAPAMHQELVTTNGDITSLRSFGKSNGFLVVFSCNTCPFVLQWENRYNEIYAFCATNDIGMVLINSNEAKRDGDDSFQKMKEKAEKSGYKMPYAMDSDHVLADAFGARTTPHIFLFDKDYKLAYKGAIDDNGENPKDVTKHYLMDAMAAMVNGKTIEPNTTKSIGCSIKRVEQ